MFKLTALFVAALVWTTSTTEAHQDVLNVHGSGTTNPSKCFWGIMEDFTDQAKHPIRMTYRAVGSTTGIAEFVNNNSTVPAADFGSGDLPLSKAAYDGLKERNITVMQLPVLLSAVSVFHNVPLDDADATVDLDACLLARIFNREIKTWGHPDIVASNPALEGSELPISVARRVRGSSSTASITEYLYTACPDVWPADRVGALVTWPEDTMECEGSGGVTDCITSTPGAIGYIDAGHGIAEGLPEIALKNADGTVQTSAKAAERGGIASALAATEPTLPATPFDDWSMVNLLNKPGADTWPIVLLTYVYVRQDLTFMGDPDEQTLLKAFLKSLYDDAYVTQCVADHGFTKTTDTMAQKALQAIDTLIVSPEAKEWFIESSTTPIVSMDDLVISQKRRTHNEVERDVLFGQVEELTERTAELELLLTDSRTTLARVEEDSFDKDAMLTIALVLSALSFAMCIILMSIVCSKMGHKPTATD